MANQQLVDYIKENLSRDISIKQIKKSLLGVGWSESDINGAIKAAKDHPKNSKMPLPREKSGKTNTLAILSLIFAFLFPPIGLILGVIALSEVKKDTSLKGRGLAIAGIILSSFFIIIYSILFFINYSAISGYLSPSSDLPPGCQLVPGISCTEFKVDGKENTVAFTVENGFKQDLIPFDVSIGGKCDGYASADGGLLDGEEERIVISCSKDIKGATFQEEITIMYRPPNGLLLNRIGSISAQVE